MLGPRLAWLRQAGISVRSSCGFFPDQERVVAWRYPGALGTVAASPSADISHIGVSIRSPLSGS